MSLDEPKPVDSILTFPSGYDTLEYSWVKSTVVSVRLRILFMKFQSTNSGQAPNRGGEPCVGSSTRGRPQEVRVVAHEAGVRIPGRRRRVPGHSPQAMGDWGQRRGCYGVAVE